MDKLFFYDPLNGEKITYQILLSELNKENIFYYPYCYNKNIYEIFKNIIISLITNQEIVLLDYDFSNEELENLSITKDKLSTIKELKYSSLKDTKDLISRIKKSLNWEITLFTSGTTGMPKKFTHTFKSVTKAVKVSKNKENNIWGFAYNPTHIAGLQVFFQAILNYNSIINLFQLSRENIFKQIEKYKITHISATPTFYRLLLPFEKELKSVKRITFGGEKYDNNLEKGLRKIFPCAKFLNIYASTEAGSIFASDDDVFVLKNEYKSLIKIIDNELLIHKDILGKSEAVKLDGLWYHTGDIVEIIEENPITFKFKYRKNEMINVGGNKVYSYEVEEAIKKHPSVRNVVVYGRSNPIVGNLVCCDIEIIDKRITERDVRLFLLNKLQSYKIPRIINFVDKISITRTGKIKSL